MSRTVTPVASGYKAFGGTTAQWAASNDKLKYREMGVEYTMDGRVLMKFGVKTEGDVGTPWNELPYSSGPAGPALEHEWQETSLRFKNPDGSWGEAVQLKGNIGPIGPAGPPGPEGTSTPATKVKIGGVIVGDGLDVDEEGCVCIDPAYVARLIDPWDIYPPRSPIPVDGVTFPTGANARHPIMPGETKPRMDWFICDGGSDGKGGTVPDMRDRMIMGAGPKHPAGSKGGAETHTHSITGTVAATTLSVAQMPGHVHGILLSTSGSNGYNGVYGLSNAGSTQNNSQMVNSGGSGSHIHAMTASSKAAGNLPPYCVVGTFIMRIS